MKNWFYRKEGIPMSFTPMERRRMMRSHLFPIGVCRRRAWIGRASSLALGLLLLALGGRPAFGQALPPIVVVEAEGQVGASADASCPAGYNVVGGGWDDGFYTNIYATQVPVVRESYPFNPTTWRVTVIDGVCDWSICSNLFTGCDAAICKACLNQFQCTFQYNSAEFISGDERCEWEVFQCAAGQTKQCITCQEQPSGP